MRPMQSSLECTELPDQEVLTFLQRQCPPECSPSLRQAATLLADEGIVSVVDVGLCRPDGIRLVLHEVAEDTVEAVVAAAGVASTGVPLLGVHGQHTVCYGVAFNHSCSSESSEALAISGADRHSSSDVQRIAPRNFAMVPRVL